MASFYGNIKNNSRASFIFDKIYSSRKEMEDALKSEEGDGIFVNRYVLVDYGFKRAENDGQDEWVDRYEIQTDVNNQPTGTRVENSTYRAHRVNDADEFNGEYDQTVWMKIYTNNIEKYIMVARLKAEAPAFEIVSCAPGEHDGVPHFDLKNSTDINYKYHVPKNWEWVINNFNPSTTCTATRDKNIYEQINHTGNKTYHTGHEYPYFNKAGFDPKIQSETSTDSTDEIKVINTKSGTKYPQHVYEEISLTKDTYIPNRYYIKNNNTYSLATVDFDASQSYYIDTISATATYANDIKRVDIHIPSIGNMVSKSYDILYGEPRSSGLKTTDSLANNYATESSDTAYIYCKVGNKDCYLTSEEFRALPIEDGTIDVIPQKKYRPYNQDDVFKYNNIDPYDNIKDSDPISVAWAIENLKQYISELRYLANGDGIVGYTNTATRASYTKLTDNNKEGSFIIYPSVSAGNANQGGESYSLTADQIEALQPYSTTYPMPVYRKRGLQSDWMLDDAISFGYIYNKPRVLWTDDTNSETIKSNQAELNMYTKHTIDYIYQYCNDSSKTNADLFGTRDNIPSSFLNN